MLTCSFASVFIRDLHILSRRITQYRMQPQIPSWHPCLLSPLLYLSYMTNVPSYSLTSYGCKGRPEHPFHVWPIQARCPVRSAPLWQQQDILIWAAKLDVKYDPSVCVCVCGIIIASITESIYARKRHAPAKHPHKCNGFNGKKAL